MSHKWSFKAIINLSKLSIFLIFRGPVIKSWPGKSWHVIKRSGPSDRGLVIKGGPADSGSVKKWSY